MAVVATPRVFDKRFAFKVEIDGFGSASFMKCSELEAEVAEIKQYEGGALIPQKSFGRVDYKDITLERGATKADYDMWLWFLQVINAGANTGLSEQLVKRHLDVVQLGRDGIPIKRWSVFNAFPKIFTAGAWDNTVDENVIEKLVLGCDFWTPTPL